MYPVSKILVIIDTGLVGLLILHLQQEDSTHFETVNDLVFI